MKIRFAVGAHAGSLSGAEMAAFAEALEAAGFDGLWLSDLPVAPVLDPLLGLALAAGREVDPEHFGMSIPYARVAPEAELLAPLAARRPDVDPLAFVPVGRAGLRGFIEGYIDAGLSKFVVRPLAPVASWAEESAWLSDAILELQT